MTRRFGMFARVLAIAAVAVGCGTEARSPLSVADTRSSTAMSLSASISGPGTIRFNTTCEWYGIASGGTAPYTYYWTRTGSTRTSTENPYLTSSSTSFTITLTVTDSNGLTGTATKGVGISSSAPMCFP